MASPEKGPRHAFITTRPLEQITYGDGRGAVVLGAEVSASDEATAGEAIQAVADHLGAKIVDGVRDGSTFFFPAGSWPAPWSPEGPKKNWGYAPPSNPSLN